MKRKLLLTILTGTLLASTLMACGSNENTTNSLDNEIVENVSNGDASVENEDSNVEENENKVDNETNNDIVYEDVENESIVASDKVMDGVNIVKTTMGEEYFPNMPLDSTMLEGLTGLTSDMYTSFYAEMPMISAVSDMLIVIEPAEGMKDAVVEKLNDYKTYQIEDSFQYPTNKIKVQATEVKVIDGLVYYIATFGDTNGLEENEEDLLAKCQENVKKVIDALEK